MIPNMSRENSHRLSVYDIPSPGFAVLLTGRSPARFNSTPPLYNGVTDSVVSVVNENPESDCHAQSVAPF
jgi:hypothetical protein